MTSRSVTMICGFDFRGAEVTPLSDPWPAPAHDGDGYRWLHFDLAEPGLSRWARAHLPEIAARALVQSETRPRCERLADGLILNLRGVNLDAAAAPEDMVSLRMWLTDRVIVSARARRSFAIEVMRQSADDPATPQTLGLFVAELIDLMTKRIEAVSLEVEDIVDGCEEAMIADTPPPLEEISRHRQKVIKLRRHVSPQREALDVLAWDGVVLLGEEACQLIRESANRTRRSLEELDAARDRLSAIQDHADMQQTQRLARNGHLLSVVAAVFLPLGFLAGLFGANVAGVPGASEPMAFWLLALASCAVGVVVFLLLKLFKLL